MAVPVPPPFSPGGLGEKIERLGERMMTKLFNVLLGPIGEACRTGIDNLLEGVERVSLHYVRPVVGRIRDAPGIPAEWKALLDRIHDPEEQLEVGAVLAVAAGLVVGIIQGAIQPVARIVSYFVERLVQTGRPDPVSLYQMWRRGAFDDSLRDSYLDDLGISDNLKAGFKALAEIRPGLSELITLWLRGHLSTPDFHARLQQEGVSQEYIADIEKLAESMPGPGDLVRFALREVWRDDLRGELLSPNAPGRYYDLMAKSGYAHEFAEDYWASHWEIPAIRQGFEMFWRLDNFNEADLRALLTRLDVLPAYHDSLIQIAYQTYTRVDARRMYAAGVLSEDEVFRSYRDQGYDSEKARKLADFAIADAISDDRDLTKADILNGYRDGILSLSEAGDMLQAINFGPEAAAFLLARVDTKRAQKLIDAEVRVLKDLFLNGDLSLPQVQERLTALGLPSRQIELYVQEWQIDRRGKVKRPSRATLERLYKSGAITQEEFTETLDAIGYQDKYIGWYLRNISLERQKEAEKEEERARKERERVEKDRKKTKYQRDKAEIDVEVAEIQAAISAADVALVETQNDKAEALRAALPLEQRAEIERDYMLVTHDADAAIGSAQVMVANLRAEDKGLRLQLADINQSLATNVDIAAQVDLKAAIATMRTEQARFTDAAAFIRVEIARLKEAAAIETDPAVLDQMALDLLALQTRETEEKQAITDVGIDIKEAQEQLGITMAETRRQELQAEQANVRIEIADLAERIAQANASIAATATAKTNAKNAMNAELSRLPGAVEELEIRQHYDSLIERIKAQVKELRVRLSQVRVQKALLTFEYKGPAG